MTTMAQMLVELDRQEVIMEMQGWGEVSPGNRYLKPREAPPSTAPAKPVRSIGPKTRTEKPVIKPFPRTRRMPGKTT